MIKKIRRKMINNFRSKNFSNFTEIEKEKKNL